MGLRSIFSVAFAAVCFCNIANAQPPNISRWTGLTALPQTQGFSQGSPLTLTWGFAALGSAINGDGAFPDAPNNFQTRFNTIYAGGQAEWQPLFQQVFDRWSSISGLSYVLEAADDGAALTNANIGIVGTRADVRIGGKFIDGNGGVLAYNWFPNRADMVFDTADNYYETLTNNSIRLRNITSHEHGHGVGMPHLDSNNSAQLMEPFIQLGFDGPQLHDILVAQRGYGDANEKGLGNDTAALATTLGTIANGSTVTRGNDAVDAVVASTDVDFVSIDDTLDTDFFKFTIGSAGDVSLSLEAMGPSYNATSQGAGGNVAFNTKMRSDLALALMDTNGTTVLQNANATGLGGNEAINNFSLAAGTYFARIKGTNNGDSIALDTQFYKLGVSFVSAMPEPGSLALLGGLAMATLFTRRRQS